MDVVDPGTRSRMMSRVRGKDTKPELQIRRAIHRRGFRYRIHDGRLPGHPDIVFPKYRAVIFVHGCFWHGHDCPLFRMPSSRREYWEPKIRGNRERDLRHLKSLEEQGWRYLTVWECALRGKGHQPFTEVIEEACSWLQTDRPEFEIRCALI